MALQYPITLVRFSVFLPLPLNSCLPFHVNGFFDVGKDRRGLRVAQNSSEFNWNKHLVENALPQAFIIFLSQLVLQFNPSTMSDEKSEACLKDYYSLWPGNYSSVISSTSNVESTNWIANAFSNAVKKCLGASSEKLLWSKVNAGQWVSHKEACMFSDCALKLSHKMENGSETNNAS